MKRSFSPDRRRAQTTALVHRTERSPRRGAGVGLVILASILGADVARGDDTSPSVAYSLPEDAYVVIWQDERDPDGRGNDIWGRILDGGGTPNADEIRPSGNGDTEDENLYPGAGALACSTGSGHVLGVWTDTFRESTRGWDVFGRVIEIEDPPEG